MAATRRSQKSAETRDANIPSNTDLRMPSLASTQWPRNVAMFKATIHDDVIAQIVNGATLMFHDKDYESGMLSLKDGDHELKAVPVEDLHEVMVSVSGRKLRVTGCVQKYIEVERNVKWRARSSPSQKKRGQEDVKTNGGPKRQRVSTARSSRGSLNGVAAASPYQSPYVSPGPRNTPMSTPGRTGRGSSSPSSTGEEEVRKSIIHVLALGEMSETNLRKRILEARESPMSDATFRKLLREVGRYGKSGYVLREESWREVLESYVGYTESDQKRLREVLGRRAKRKAPGLRSSRSVANGHDEAPIIVKGAVSDAIISKALDQFEKHGQRTVPIRSAKEEQDAHSLWDAWHSVYVQVNLRLDAMREDMEKLGRRYDNAKNTRDRGEVEREIHVFHEKSMVRHEQYCKFLPLLHKKLKSLLARMEVYAQSDE